MRSTSLRSCVRHVAAASTAILLLGSSAGAAVLINFHNSATFPSATSPGTTVGGYTGNNWNNINSDGGVMPLTVNSDGTPLAGVSVDLGKEPSGGAGNIDWGATGFSFNDLGAQVGGVYAGSNAQSGVFVNNGQTSDVGIGLRISGLAPGPYEFYFTARNTNNDGPFGSGGGAWDDYLSFLTTVPTASGATAFPGSGGVDLIPNDLNPASWIAGQNYITGTVNVAAGEDVVILLDPTEPTESRGFLNTVEFQLIPEPATVALLGLGGLVLIRRRRR